MKKTILFFVCSFLTLILQAQTSKSVNITAGSLSNATPQLVIKYASKPPVVDGYIDDVDDPWGDFIDINVRSPFNTTNGMTGQFNILAGVDAFYIAIIVQDSTPNSNATAIPNSWGRDCSEIYISMDTLTGPTGAYKKGCWQIRTQRTGEILNDGISPGPITWSLASLTNDPNFQVASEGSSTEYVQELVLPYSALTTGMDPSWDGKFIRFDLYIADNTTGSAGGRTEQLFWWGNNGLGDDHGWDNTKTLGVAQLPSCCLPGLVWEVTPKSVSIAASEGSNSTVNIESSVAWAAISNQTWLTVTPASGNGNNQLRLTATVNTVSTTRTATVTISSSGITSQTITVTQEAGQVFKTINITAGGLSSALTALEKNTITNLTITGIIDARDFKTMRDSMLLLAVIDLSSATVAAYTGTDGTAGTGSIVYAANAVPDHGFSFQSGYNIKLLSVILPSSVNTIETSAFGYCVNLTSVTIPSSVTNIGNSAFCYCSALSAVTIPGSVNSIGNFSFGNCTSLTSINIPSSVTSIKDLAFYGCNGLTTPTITISSSLTSIGTEAFAACNGSISVDASNPNYSSVNGVLFNKTQTALIQCLTSTSGSYTMPSTVTTIETYAFYVCNKITGITIPSTVTSIKTMAFYGTSGLISINIPSTLLSIGYGAFITSSGLISVDPDNPNYSALDGVLFNKDKTVLIACPTSKTGNFTIPSSVTSIGSEAFESCRLNSVTIPSSVTTIADYAFFGCGLLTSIYLNGITPIDLSSSFEIFYFVNISTCTLYVPAGSLSAYKAASIWNGFSHIIEGNGFWLSASNINIAKTAGSTATAVVNSNTSWTAISDQTWLTVSPNTATTGNGTLTFTALANPIIAVRTATVTVSVEGLISKTITINQEAGDAILSVSTSTANVAKNAGSTASVNVTSNATWTAISDQTWLAVSPNTATTGSGTLTFTASVNPAVSTRTATVTVSATGLTAKTITVTQAAGDATLSVYSTTVSIAKDAGSTTSINVTSNATWTAISDQTWLTVSPNTATTGSGTLTFTASVNPAVSTRTATVTVSATGVTAKTITVTQAAGDATLSVSSTTVSIAKDAGSTTSVNVTSNTTWTAISGQTWLTVSPNIATTGNGTIIFTASANPTVSTRTATVTVSATGVTAKTITVTQAIGVGTGVQKETIESISLYPNPVKDILYLSNIDGVKQFVICNIDGRIIESQKNLTTKSINISNLDKGIYLIHITTEKSSLIKKIIKE